MKVAGGGAEQCCNAQAVVDSESRLSLLPHLARLATNGAVHFPIGKPWLEIHRETKRDGTLVGVNIDDEISSRPEALPDEASLALTIDWSQMTRSSP